uniref:Uncharacterized protein n=1 Tax=viral metagenome TaxID=1070528 RepID=A0A6M3JSJ6_9ZZZZ
MKRKYTRKVSPEVVQVKSDGFKYSDLPLSLRKEIEHIIEWRKMLDLFDDSVERKERALRYWEFKNGKTIH